MIGFEIDPKDLDAMLEDMVAEIRNHIVNDTFNRIRNNIISMNLVGFSNQLLTETMPDYDRGCIYINAKHAGFVEFGCYDTQTEALTQRGWLKYNEVTENDMVLEFKPETHELRWTKVQKVIKKRHDGMMVSITGKNVDLLVTPNHRMVYYTKGNNGKFGVIKKTRADMMGNYHCFHIPRSGKFTGNNHSESFKFVTYKRRVGKVSEVDKIIEPELNDLISFAGLYVAEGCRLKDPSYTISIKQNDGPKSRKIDTLMKRLGFNYGRYAYEQEYRGRKIKQWAYRIHNKSLWEWLGQFGDGAHNKRIPHWIKELDVSVQNIFLKWYGLGDGWEGRAFGTVSETLADDVQEMLIKCGYGASKRKYTSNPCWTILKSRPFLEIYPHKKKNITAKDYHGIVWDVYIGGGYLVVRRNGLACISGNTVGQVSVPADPYAGKPLAGPVRGPGRKGPPPLPPMSRWVKAKGLAGKSKTMTQKMVDAADSIRWGIFWHGGKPHPFTRDALDVIRNKYDGAEIVLEVEVAVS